MMRFIRKTKLTRYKIKLIFVSQMSTQSIKLHLFTVKDRHFVRFVNFLSKGYYGTLPFLGV